MLEKFKVTRQITSQGARARSEVQYATGYYRTEKTKQQETYILYKGLQIRRQ